MSTNDEDETTQAEDAAAAETPEDDNAVEAEAADERPEKKTKDGGTAPGKSAPGGKPPARSGFPWLGAAVVAVVVLCGALVFGYFQYREAEDKYRESERDLAQIHQSEADRNTATKMAKDYALKSLTYTYQDPDGFFASVEDGVSPTLKDKYANVSELLKGIMTQAKVESSGEILAADVAPQPGNVYQVVVSASQTTKNLQNPQPRVSPIILQVVVSKIGDTWQISDIGPKSGAKPPLPSDQAPAESPAAVAPVPPASNAAATPLVPRSH